MRTNLTGLTVPQRLALFGLMPVEADDSGPAPARSEDGLWIWDLPVQTIEVGLSNVDVFVGYTDPAGLALDGAVASGELTLDDLVADGAIGLFFDEVSLGLLLASALPVASVGTGTLNAAFLKFFTLKVNADTVALLGVPELDLRGEQLEVRVNQGSFVPGAWPQLPLLPPPVIDFAQSFPDDSSQPADPDTDPDGYPVQTSTTNTDPVVLLFEQPVVGASADRILLRVSDFVYISGGFSFNKGPVELVDVRTNLTGLTVPQRLALFGLMPVEADDSGPAPARSEDGLWIWDLPVQTIEVGLSNVDVFVGYTDPAGLALDGAVASGELTLDDLVADGAIGLFFDEVSLGLLLASALPVASVGTGTLNAAFLKFFTLKVNADTVALLGVPELDLRGEQLEVRVNQGSFVPGAWPQLPLLPPPVIDFAQSFPDDSTQPADPDTDPDGYPVQTSTTNTDPVVLLFEQPVVGASADRILLRVSDFVYISGGFSFNKGPVELVDVRTNLTGLTVPQRLALFGLMPVEADDSGPAPARSEDGLWIWDLPVQTIEVGLSNVDVFVGYTDPAGLALDGAVASGELTLDDLVADGAIGLFFDEVSLGLLFASALPVASVGTGTLNAAFLKFFTLKVNADTVALLGVPELDLRGEQLEVRVNQGSFVPGAWPQLPLLPPPVIDFAQSFPDDSSQPADPDTDPDGYPVQTSTTNTDPVVLLFEQPVVGASADRILLRVSDFVYITVGSRSTRGRSSLSMCGRI